MPPRRILPEHGPKIRKITKAQLNSLAAAGVLIEDSPYLVDNSSLVVATSSNAFVNIGGSVDTAPPPPVQSSATTYVSPDFVLENAVVGTVVGVVTVPTGASWTVLNDAGGRFAKSGNNLVTGATGFDYETTTSHAPVVRITNADLSSVDVTLTIKVEDVSEGGISQVSDTFSDLDGILIEDHLSDGGGRWTRSSFSTNQTSKLIVSNGRMASNGGEHFLRYSKLMNSDDYSVECDVVGLTAGNAYTGVIARFHATDKTYYSAVWNGFDKVWLIYKMVAGTYSEVGRSAVAADFAGAKKLRLTITGSTLDLYVDSVLLFSRTDTSIPTGRIAGIAIENWAAADVAQGYAVDNFRAPAIGTPPVVFNGVSYDSDANTVTATASSSSGTLEYRIWDAANHVVAQNWTPFTSSGVAMPATTAGLRRYDFRSSTTPAFYASSGNLPIAGVKPKLLGFNLNGKYYSNRDWSFVRDWINSVWITVSGGALNNFDNFALLDRGVIDNFFRVKSWPADATSIAIAPTWHPHTLELGQREWINGGLYTAANFGTAWNIDNAACTMDGAGPNGGVLLTWSSTNAVGGIRLLQNLGAMSAHSLKKVGDISTNIFTDEYVAHQALSDIHRWMDNSEVNGRTVDPLNATAANFDSWLANPEPGTDAGRLRRHYSWEHVVELANRSNAHPYVTLHINTSNDYCTKMAAYFAANLNAGLKLRVALGNEIWNAAFPVQHTVGLLGERAGYGDSNPYSGSKSVIALYPNGVGDEGVLNVPASQPAGTRVYAHMFGLNAGGIWEAKQITAANSLLPGRSAVGLENADWRYLRSADVARNRWQSVRTLQIAKIFAAGMGRSRVVPVMENHNQASYNDGEGPWNLLLWPHTNGGERFVDVLRYVDNFEFVTAPYISDRALNHTSAPGNATPGTTRVAAIVAAMNQDISEGTLPGYSVRKFWDGRVWLARKVGAEGYDPARATFGTYEHSDHLYYTGNDGVTQAQKDSMVADINAAKGHADLYGPFKTYLGQIAKHGGPNLFYKERRDIPIGYDWGAFNKIPVVYVELGGRSKAVHDFHTEN